MARKKSRPTAEVEWRLEPQRETCIECQQTLWVGNHIQRTLLTLQGFCRLRVVIRRCVNAACPRYRQAYRPEEEGRWALPHGECGLDVIALVGTLRYREHRSVPEFHRALQQRQLPVCQRTVDHLLERYEELVSLHLQQRERIAGRLKEQGRALLALDGLQPDVGHEVLWVVREVLSGEILLARPLLSGAQKDLAALLQEACTLVPVPIEGIVSDGQLSIRSAVAAMFPDVPHQLCHFHFLREAAKPIVEADRHAKKELKKQVRGIRPIEHQLEQSQEAQAETMRGYCVAVRAALTNDGIPPLAAAGLRLLERLTQIRDSLQRVAEKRGCPNLSSNCSNC